MNPFRLRRVRIVESGWAGFTGPFGSVEFIDGVSVDPVSFIEQQRLGGLIRIESAEDDEADEGIGPAAELVRGRNIQATEEVIVGASTGTVGSDGEVKMASANYSREELETIADAKGINGLREVAQAWNVTGRSISELITKILLAQNGGIAADDA